MNFKIQPTGGNVRTIKCPTISSTRSPYHLAISNFAECSISSHYKNIPSFFATFRFVKVPYPISVMKASQLTTPSPYFPLLPSPYLPYFPPPTFLPFCSAFIEWAVVPYYFAHPSLFSNHFLFFIFTIFGSLSRCRRHRAPHTFIPFATKFYFPAHEKSSSQLNFNENHNKIDINVSTKRGFSTKKICRAFAFILAAIWPPPALSFLLISTYKMKRWWFPFNVSQNFVPKTYRVYPIWKHNNKFCARPAKIEVRHCQRPTVKFVG